MDFVFDELIKNVTTTTPVFNPFEYPYNGLENQPMARQLDETEMPSLFSWATVVTVVLQLVMITKQALVLYLQKRMRDKYDKTKREIRAIKRTLTHSIGDLASINLRPSGGESQQDSRGGGNGSGPSRNNEPLDKPDFARKTSVE